MSVYFSSLNSGSNGNCYYVGNNEEAVIVDVGISCREVERRMKSVSLDLRKVKAIVVSHEHTDHIRGVEMLSKKYSLPVYITGKTASISNLRISSSLQKEFDATETICIGSLRVKPFKKYHDAVDPHSFMISSGGINVGVFTDLGQPCNELSAHFSQCDAAFLEANYDTNMLESGSYPYFLKKRICGGLGHLSNTEALEIFVKHRSNSLQYLLLAHLSRDNNCPNLVNQLFNLHGKNTKVSIASRYFASPVFSLLQKNEQENFQARQLSIF